MLMLLNLCSHAGIRPLLQLHARGQILELYDAPQADNNIMLATQYVNALAGCNCNGDSAVSDETNLRYSH